MNISVVIAACNAQPWIAEALRSVAAQTCAADEVVVVDDGSTDSTATIASQCGARVISIANSGVSAARNCGIDAARNDWIALLDADDVWHPDKLARQVEAAHAATSPVAIVSCDHYQFGDDGRLLLPSALEARRERYRRVRPLRIAPDVTRLANMGYGLITLGQVLFPSTLLLRRDLCRRIGGFDPTFRTCEDYEFLLRALVHSDVALVEQPLMGYRKHPAGHSRDHVAMSVGLVAMGAKMAAQPQRYAPGALNAFKPRLREALMFLARAAIRQHDRVRAEQMLDAAGRIRGGADWLLLSVANRVPRRTLAGLIETRRRIAGPH